MFENEDKRRCSVCKIPFFERNNFYYGKLMTVRDYFAEQCYFNEKRWLMNMMVHGWGVVCGLDVKRILKDPRDPTKGYSDTKVKVTEGMAIDCCGREILVCEDQYIDLDPKKIECHHKNVKKEELQNLVICLEYNECKSESINIKSEACDLKEKSQFNRIRDSFKISVRCKEDIGNDNRSGSICPLDNRIGVWFDWDKVRREDIDPEDELRFKEYLIQKYDVDWVRESNIDKDDRIIEVKMDDNKISLEINEDKTKVVLKINETWKDEFIVEKNEKNELIVFKNQTVHHYLCKELKEGCPECPKHSCLILAEVTIDPPSTGTESPRHFKIDICSRRKLVYSNPMLYDMINCYHGDLPHITSISWPHGKEIEWSEFFDLIKRKQNEDDVDGPGLQVVFDREVTDLDERTFMFIVKYPEDREGGFSEDRYIPGEVNYNSETKKGVFKVDLSWFIDLGISALQEGAGFKIVIRGDHILDKDTKKALDGNFIGGKLPSGNGTQGGDFVSWFYVKKNENYESLKSRHYSRAKSKVKED